MWSGGANWGFSETPLNFPEETLYLQCEAARAWEGFFLEMKNRGRKFPRNFRNFHFQRKFPLPGEPAEATPHETLAVAEPATGSNTI